MITSKEGISSCIPPLKDADGQWVLDPKGKADLFAKSFAEKFVLPDASVNEYTDIRANGGDVMSGFLPVRRRHAESVLKGLRLDSATGPDALGAKVLARFHKEFAQPLCIIARQILNTGCWPKPWKDHWVFPLYKKRCKATPGNYRGIHLSAQFSKACERLLGRLWTPYLQSSGALGRRQFAYKKATGYRDALAFNVNSWLWALAHNRRVALHCADVSGAFDKVEQRRLLSKLQTSGIHPKLLQVISSWLDGRDAYVIVDGVQSRPLKLSNMVYQGTVWGPVLWSVFYEDVGRPVDKTGYTESVYADDLNCWRVYPVSVGDEVIRCSLRTCQAEIHKWGAANSITFDNSKESQHILHHRDGRGDNFKILGLLFDPRLSMFHAATGIVRETSFRLRRVLRLRGHFCTNELMMYYKSEVLGYIEGFTAGIYHASPYVLQMVDDVQSSFLASLDMSEEVAFKRYRLAPLCTRRDIAMLGLLHRVVLRSAPEPLRSLFPLARSTLFEHGFGRGPCHTKQLADPIMPGHSACFKRSLFGLVAVYNQLPSDAVACNTVKAFQAALQRLLESKLGMNDWRNYFKRTC